MTAVQAQDTDNDSGSLMSEKFYVRLGYLVLENTSTQISLNKSDGFIGTSFDYQRDLGGDDSAGTGRFAAYYRFTPKHRIDFSTYAVNRDANRTLEIEIDFGDEEYEIGETVSSELDTRFYRVSYGYSFYHSKRAEIGLIGGLHVMDYSIKIERGSDGTSEAADVTAPLPVWGLRVNYGITPKWFFKFVYENFYIDLNDDIIGSLLDSSVGIEWRPSKHVGAGFALVRTALDAEVNTSDYEGELADLYRGGELYIATFF
jgi:hypothetical protein